MNCPNPKCDCKESYTEHYKLTGCFRCRCGLIVLNTDGDPYVLFFSRDKIELGSHQSLTSALQAANRILKLGAFL